MSKNCRLKQFQTPVTENIQFVIIFFQNLIKFYKIVYKYTIQNRV